MNGIDTSKKLKHLATSMHTLVEDNKYGAGGALTKDTPNGKFIRLYNQAEATSATGTHARKINGICKELDIDPGRFEDYKWAVDMLDVYKIREHCSKDYIFKRTKDQEVAVIVVSTLKGGGGKTTFTTTIGTGFATELSKQYRVAVIDLDAQGTATMLLKPNFDDDDLSVGDLLMENFDIGKDESIEDVYRSAFYDTVIPNLKVLGSRTDDREYEYYVEGKRLEANAAKETYNAYEKLQEILDAVKDDFDVIFLDTAPQFNALTLAGHYVANNLIVPIRPSENDRDSSEKYMSLLHKMYDIMLGMGHGGYSSVKVVISAIKKGSQAQRRIANKIRTALNGSDLIAQDFIDSDAVTNCAEDYNTVFDVSGSHYTATKMSLRKAQQEFTHLIEEIELMVKEFWGVRNG